MDQDEAFRLGPTADRQNASQPEVHWGQHDSWRLESSESGSDGDWQSQANRV